jgi:hypothetical protein
MTDHDIAARRRLVAGPASTLRLAKMEDGFLAKQKPIIFL